MKVAAPSFGIRKMASAMKMAKQAAAPRPPGNARGHSCRWNGIAQRERERRHADHPDQIAHEARPCGRVQRVAQVCVQRLLDDEADACSNGEDHGEGEFEHGVSRGKAVGKEAADYACALRTAIASNRRFG